MELACSLDHRRDDAADTLFFATKQNISCYLSQLLSNRGFVVPIKGPMKRGFEKMNPPSISQVE